jgi:MFS transporter, ACS family, glucarate transporter
MIPRRFILVGGTFLLSVLLYVDRTCISLAKDNVTSELGLTNEHWAWVLAAFAFGYALFQTPGGMLADRLGGRMVLTAVVAAWSLFTGLTAAAWNLTSMLVVRFLFGAGEAGAFPGMAKVVHAWIPVQERGLVKGINFSGSRLGAALAMPLVAGLIAQLGWKMTFLVLMGIGFAWALFWWRWFRDEPAEHPSLSEDERAYILQHRQGTTASPPSQGMVASSPPESPLAAGTPLIPGMTRTPSLPAAKTPPLLSRNLWLMMLQYFASNFTFFFSLTWLYPYVKSKYGLTAVDAGLYAMVPLLGGAVGNILAGWLVDALYRGGRLTLSRKLPAIIGFLLAALGMVLSVDQSTAVGAIAWLTIAIFGADMTLSPSWSFCIDIGGRNAGAVSGTMNMAGNLGSAITALAFAYLPETSKGNAAFFYTAAALSLIGATCWLFANPGKTLVKS